MEMEAEIRIITHHRSNPFGGRRLYRRLYSSTASPKVLLARFNLSSHSRSAREMSSYIGCAPSSFTSTKPSGRNRCFPRTGLGVVAAALVFSSSVWGEFRKCCCPWGNAGALLVAGASESSSFLMWSRVALGNCLKRKSNTIRGRTKDLKNLRVLGRNIIRGAARYLAVGASCVKNKKIFEARIVHFEVTLISTL